MTLIKTLSAAAMLVITGVAVAPALAETDAVSSMQQGLDMLRTALEAALPEYGIDVDVSALTLEQVAEIMGAINENRDNPQGVARAVEVAINTDS